MSECPVCNFQFVAAYLHIDHNYLLCKDCFKGWSKYYQNFKFIPFSLLNKSINSEICQINAKLKIYLSKHKQNLDLIFKENLLQTFFELKKLSSTITIDTTDCSQKSGSFDLDVQNQLSNREVITEKYRATMQRFTQQIQPVKQSFIKTKESFLKSTAGLKLKMQNVKQQYLNLQGEFPPLKTMAVQSIKKVQGVYLANSFDLSYTLFQIFGNFGQLSSFIILNLYIACNEYIGHTQLYFATRRKELISVILQKSNIAQDKQDLSNIQIIDKINFSD